MNALNNVIERTEKWHGVKYISVSGLHELCDGKWMHVFTTYEGILCGCTKRSSVPDPLLMKRWASYPNSIGGFFRGSKEAGLWSWPRTSF